MQLARTNGRARQDQEIQNQCIQQPAGSTSCLIFQQRYPFLAYVHAFDVAQQGPLHMQRLVER